MGFSGVFERLMNLVPQAMVIENLYDGKKKAPDIVQGSWYSLLSTTYLR